MKYSIVQSYDYDQTYVVEASQLTTVQVQNIVKVLDRQMGITSEPTVVLQDTERIYTDLSTFDGAKLAALYDAAKLYYARKLNKILTIEHIRTLTGCTLKQALELVDYAIGITVAPSWWST